MKKTLFFAMMAAVLGLISCSKEETAQPETAQKGMVLHATVAQSEDTKATFTDNEGVWHFSFAEGDKIMVTNSKISTDYTFTNNGTDFISTDAEPTSEKARWYAYYPSKNVSLVGQTGKWEDLANLYPLVGYTPYPDGDVTGEDGLNITMNPNCAILKIINQKGNIDINVKSGDYWVTGLKASQASFAPTLMESKQTLLSTTERGTYYIAVPAGIALTVYDGEKVIRSTSKGLTKGKYYELELSIGRGEAEANGIGNVKWIQLWQDGPKFAEFNIGAKSATDYGEYFQWASNIASTQWGSNWRMPTREELANEPGGLLKECDCKWFSNYNGTGINGLLCTGKGDYSGNSIFLPATGNSDFHYNPHLLNDQNINGAYWSSTQYSSSDSYGLFFQSDYFLVSHGLWYVGKTVRAVFAK